MFGGRGGSRPPLAFRKTLNRAKKGGLLGQQTSVKYLIGSKGHGLPPPPPSERIEIRLWVKVTSINQETSHSLPPSGDKHCQNFYLTPQPSKLC